MKQIHKKFSSQQVKEILGKYAKGGIKREFIQEILGIGRSRFFDLIKKYRQEDENFSIKYQRQSINQKLDDEYDEFILNELKTSKDLIDNPEIPTYRYNYSYSSQEIKRKYGIAISVPTIINRAKKWGYYKERRKSRKTHDRVVYTNHTGELIQHDSSHHLFAPLACKKWYLITSIDDFSRLLLEARFVETESSLEHIKSLERVFTNHGFPYSYYTDSHSIFRFVAGRDDMLLHHNSYIPTDGIDTQWLQVLKDCGVKRIPALSPQAKGKVERPYQWIQDHVVRRCMSDNVVKLSDGQQILNELVGRYNYKNIHSTTKEVPYYRFKKALKNNNSLWRAFTIPKPFVSKKDIFSLRLQRTADGYRTISLKNLKLKVNGLNPYDDVDIRIYKLNNHISELRFWRDQHLLDTQIIKNCLLKGFQL
jgi:transposase